MNNTEFYPTTANKDVAINYRGEGIPMIAGELFITPPRGAPISNPHRALDDLRASFGRRNPGNCGAKESRPTINGKAHYIRVNGDCSIE